MRFQRGFNLLNFSFLAYCSFAREYNQLSLKSYFNLVKFQLQLKVIITVSFSVSNPNKNVVYQTLYNIKITDKNDAQFLKFKKQVHKCFNL